MISYNMRKESDNVKLKKNSFMQGAFVATLGIIICIYAVLDIIDCILIKVKYVETKNEITKIVSEQ